jgi:hypothetical protein
MTTNWRSGGSLFIVTNVLPPVSSIKRLPIAAAGLKGKCQLSKAHPILKQLLESTFSETTSVPINAIVQQVGGGQKTFTFFIKAKKEK